MAISFVNNTEVYTNPVASKITFNHTHTAGDDRFLVVFVHTPGVDTTGITYDGDSMTLVGEGNYGAGFHWDMYILDDPNSGTNVLDVTFASSPAYKIDVWAASFNGCSGYAQAAAVAASLSPKQYTFPSAVTANSYLVVGAYCIISNLQNIEIPTGTAATLSVDRTLDAGGDVGYATRQITAGGTTQVEANVSFGNIGLMVIELLEAAGGEPTTLRRNRCIVV